MRIRHNAFITVRSEGALLPPDFLQRIAEGDKDVPGLNPTDYHLQEREKLSEAITRSWNRLLGFWAAFQTASANLKEGDAATGLTRDKWLLPLFQELGYGRLPAGKGFEIDGKSYPISHVWQNAPIHLLGRNVDLDRPTKGVAGAAKASPHGLVQEFLNRHEGHLWGFLSNGLKLRILRDNKSLTRQAYVEFDLGGMMDGQVYSDFALLWRLCHQSRVEAERAEQCWLEKWADAARQRGTRALDQLRDGVEQAIRALGRGFLAHLANKELIEKLRAGTLDKQDYYREVLRTVYRLIFLFVAEDRDLLLTAPPGSPERERYLRHYSAARLRTLAERRRGSPHADLWQGLRLVFAKLSSDTGCPELGLPALGSFLWSDKATPDLDRCDLANADLLEAVRSLAFTVDGSIRRAIDYRNLGAEELGSVYESLLELHPEVNADAPTFELTIAAGHERKTTGSYYTPTSLIECLLDSALEPVLHEAAKQADPEKAILDLKVCDPACGSGHFLIAAAHRMANRLAAVRTGDEEPSPEAVRKALRDIVGRCLYGVDINPMAVELCKVNLWLEALEPGKPLSFLEHHIQCGNSLLGATPALLKKGIPDEAFEPLEGDDKKVCRILKKQNKAEREGQQGSLLDALHGLPEREIEELSAKVAALDAIPDETIQGQKRKQEAWSGVVASAPFDHAKLVADAWCAAFVCKKVDDPVLLYGLTERIFRRLQQNPASVPDWMRAEITRLAREYQFFHWHLAFPVMGGQPPVASSGGVGAAEFDVVLGNPPWEHAELKEREWFSARFPDIARADTAAQRKKLFERLAESHPLLLAEFTGAKREQEAEVALLARSGRFPLCGRGRINSYAVFTECGRQILRDGGRLGFIVPSGLATDDTTRFFFQDLTDSSALISLYDFENSGALFPDVHRSYRFCLLTLAGGTRAGGKIDFVFFAKSPAELGDQGKHVALAGADLATLNPNTRTCPVLPSARDARLMLGVHSRIPLLVREVEPRENPWDIEIRQGLFNMASDSHLFSNAAALLADGWERAECGWRRGSECYVPLLQPRHFHQFDHRYSSTLGGDASEREVSSAAHEDPRFLIQTTHVVPEERVGEALAAHGNSLEWLLLVRRITRSTDSRTVIASICPRHGVGDNSHLLFSHGWSKEGRRAAALLAILNSYVLDYCVRSKLSAPFLGIFHLKQAPVVPPEVIDEAPLEGGGLAWFANRVLELSYTAQDIGSFARANGWSGPPFRWDPARRLAIRCELDAALFHVYGIARDDVDYIMESFSIVRREEQERYDTFRTKLRILEAYDRMEAAFEASRRFGSSLDPPPADPRLAHSAAD